MLKNLASLVLLTAAGAHFIYTLDFASFGILICVICVVFFINSIISK